MRRFIPIALIAFFAVLSFGFRGTGWTGGSGTGTGDMEKATYDTDVNDTVDAADAIAGGGGAMSAQAIADSLATVDEIAGDHTYSGTATFEDTVDTKDARFNRITSMSKKKKPLITFRFDDAYDNQYTKIFPVFEAQGEIAEVAIPTNSIDAVSRMTSANVETLHVHGWGIINHTHSHVDLTTVVEDSVRAEFERADSVFTTLGITSRIATYPSNNDNKMVRRVAREYFRAAHGDYGMNYLPLETYKLYTQNIDDLADSSTFLGYVNTCAIDSTWQIFYAHSIDANDSNFINRLIDSVQSAGIQIVTTEQALDSIGNYYEAGDNFAINEEGIRIGHLNQIADYDTPLVLTGKPARYSETPLFYIAQRCTTNLTIMEFDVDSAENKQVNVKGIDFSGSNAFNSGSGDYLIYQGGDCWWKGGEYGSFKTAYLFPRYYIKFCTDYATSGDIIQENSQNFDFYWESAKKGDVTFKDGNTVSTANLDFVQFQDSLAAIKHQWGNQGSSKQGMMGNDTLIAFDSTQFRSVIDGTQIVKWNKDSAWVAKPVRLSGSLKMPAGGVLDSVKTVGDTMYCYIGGVAYKAPNVLGGGGVMSGTDILDSLNDAAREFTVNIQVDGGDLIASDGQKFIWTDGTEADSGSIYDSGDTTHISSDNPIRLGGAGVTRILDSLVIPTYAAFPATGSEGLFGADSAHDSLIAYWGAARRVIYPGSGTMSGAAIADSIDNANRTLGSNFTFSDTARFTAVLRIDSTILDANIADSNIIWNDVGAPNRSGAVRNVNIGYGSLKTLYSGDNNIAIGTYAAESLYSGGQNIAIGTGAFRLAFSDIEENVLIGYISGVYARSGANYNVGIGSQSLRDITTGDNNVAIGRYAGSSMTTNGGCVFLGYGAGGDNTDANKLFIDNSTDATPLIGGDFSTDEVTIDGELNLDSLIVGGGTEILKIVKVGSHLAIILTGADTLWAAADTSGF